MTVARRAWPRLKKKESEKNGQYKINCFICFGQEIRVLLLVGVSIIIFILQQKKIDSHCLNIIFNFYIKKKDFSCLYCLRKKKKISNRKCLLSQPKRWFIPTKSIIFDLINQKESFCCYFFFWEIFFPFFSKTKNRFFNLSRLDSYCFIERKENMKWWAKCLSVGKINPGVSLFPLRRVYIRFLICLTSRPTQCVYSMLVQAVIIDITEHKKDVSLSYGLCNT